MKATESRYADPVVGFALLHARDSAEAAYIIRHATETRKTKATKPGVFSWRTCTMAQGILRLHG